MLENKRTTMARLRLRRRKVLDELREELHRLTFVRDILMLELDKPKVNTLENLVMSSYELEDENVSLRHQLKKYEIIRRIANRGVENIWSVQTN